MNKHDIVSFFDKQAPLWDAQQERNEHVIEKILDKGGIWQGIHVLDVACGTGVLFADYQKRKVASVTGVDVSPEMVKIAKMKFPYYDIICDDAQTVSFDRKFDAVMIYNAFPHFMNPVKLIENLSSAMNSGGRLSIAHGMSRDALQKCHSDKAKNVSLPLPEKEEIADLLSPFFDVDIMISDETMYMVSGIIK